MTTGICYVLVGPDHRWELAVSLYSLRRVYDGPVAIITDDPPALPAQFDDADVQVVRGLWPGVKSPAHFLKSSLGERTPFDVSVYLDADTLIYRKPEPLLAVDKDDPAIHITPYADWTCGSKQARFRLDGVVESGLVHVDFINRLREGQPDGSAYPFVNSGVFAFAKGCPILGEWSKAMRAFDDYQHKDEMALQLLLPDYPFVNHTDHWNCNHYFARDDGKVMNRAGIWHCFGGHFGACREAGLWFDTVRGMIESNWCGCLSWMPRYARFLLPLEG